MASYWRSDISGLFYPAPRFMDTERYERSTIADVRNAAERIELLLKKYSIGPGKSSDMSRMISLAKAAPRKEIARSIESLEFFQLLQFQRISSAIVLLESEADPTPYLRKITRGSLDLFSKRRSLAKDTLWELELCSALRKGFESTYLVDPPDIVVDYGDAKLGISCKKIYSEVHMQNVMSEAVSSIGETSGLGVVALNLDCLIPENHILKESTFESARARLDEIMREFLRRHERHIKKYFERDKLLAILVTISPFCDIKRSITRFNVVAQSTIWTIPEIKTRNLLHYTRFYDHIRKVGNT